MVRRGNKETTADNLQHIYALKPLKQQQRDHQFFFFFFFFFSEIIIRVASVLPDKVGIINNICTSK